MIGCGLRLRATKGAAAVEFALVASVFIPLCLGIFDVGLLLWAKGGLQAAAALTARCAAIASPDCVDAQQYAVTTANAWVFSGIITKPNVVVANQCITAATFKTVTITSQAWAGAILPPPLNGYTLTAKAYYPMGGAAC